MSLHVAVQKTIVIAREINCFYSLCLVYGTLFSEAGSASQDALNSVIVEARSLREVV